MLDVALRNSSQICFSLPTQNTTNIKRVRRGICYPKCWWLMHPKGSLWTKLSSTHIVTSGMTFPRWRLGKIPDKQVWCEHTIGEWKELVYKEVIDLEERTKNAVIQGQPSPLAQVQQWLMALNIHHDCLLSTPCPQCQQIWLWPWILTDRRLEASAGPLGWWLLGPGGGKRGMGSCLVIDRTTWRTKSVVLFWVIF